MEPNRFEPCASESDKDGDHGGVREDGNAGRSRVQNTLVGFVFPFKLKVEKGFCIH